MVLHFDKHDEEFVEKFGGCWEKSGEEAVNLIPKDMGGGGNCFYYSTLPPGATHESHRTSTVRYISTHGDEKISERYTFRSAIESLGYGLILDWFIWHLRERFTFDEKSTGGCEYMLSARIVRDREKGILYMDQSTAITRLAQKCGLDKDPSSTTRHYATPMHVDIPTKNDEKTTEYDYLSVVGAVLHICGVSRPDCSFAVGCLARHSKTAGDEHVEALKRFVSHLYQTRFRAIVYRAPSSVEDTTVPELYESGVHPFDVDKTNPTKIFVDSDFTGADGRSCLYEWWSCNLEF